MEKIKSNKLSIFLIIIILISGSLIVFKLSNKSYALPEEAPRIISVEKTSDNPLKVTINYNLSGVTEDCYAKVIIQNGEDNEYTENISKENGPNTHVLENLEKGKEYQFKVSLCLENECKYSDLYTFSIPNDPIPNPSGSLGKISNLRASNITATSAKIIWNAAPGADCYQFKYKRSVNNNYYFNNDRCSLNTYVILKSLKPNTKYDVTVAGKKINDEKAKDSNWVYGVFTTNPDVPSIKSFKAEATTSKSIKLTWKRSSNKKVYYQIYRSTNGKNYSLIKTLTNKTTTYTNKKLKPNKTYYYKMRAIDKTTRKGKTFYGNYTAVKKIKTPLKDKKTYILVSIKKQKLWFYKKGKLVLKSNVVTGTRNHTATPKGTYKIRGKARSAYLVGDDYRSFVNYWMLIDGGLQIGLHDATWRSKFGGSIYKYNGSHGCVNLPYNVAKKIYKKAPIGTKVIVR